MRLWDLETMAPLCSTPPDGSFVRALAFVEGKRELCSATKVRRGAGGWGRGLGQGAEQQCLSVRLLGYVLFVSRLISPPPFSSLRSLSLTPAPSRPQDGVKVWGWETGSSSSGSGSSGGVFKLRASAGVQWEGVSELRVPPGSDSLLGCGFSANFVSVYSISLPDVIRSQSIRDGLGLEAKERGGERERERERERDKAERPERPPFSVIGSPEAIARTRAPSAAVSPPTTLGGAITGISGVGLLSSGGERPLSGFAAHASSLQAESKSPGSHREGPTAHRHDRHDRHGFKSVPSVRYHYDKEEDDASDLFQPRRVDRAADRGERGDRGDRGDAGGERGGDRERPERGDKESERERGPTGGRPSPREGRAAEPLSPDRGERAARGEAKDMSTSMGASFLRQEPFPLSPPQPQLQAQPHALSRQHPTSSPPRSEARHAYTAATCEAQCERMLQASAPFSSLLSTRLSSLRMLRRLWEKGDMADVVDYLCNIHETTRHDPLQLCLLADFFCAVHLRGNGLCLDSCVRLLPLLDSMLGQSRGLDAAGSGSGPGGGVHVCVAALRALVALCEAFGELIKSTRASAAGPSSAYSPVDLSREERLGKCNLCHSILLRARGQLAGLRERHARHAKSRRVGESADRLEELVSAL